MSVRAILSTLPYKIKADAENELYRDYMARCARLITEHTAGIVHGKYISLEFKDIIHPKPEETRSSQEIIDGIKSKINS